MERRSIPLPYFMAYSLPQEDTDNTKDMKEGDYFRQLYPLNVKRYLRVIVDVLDRVEVKDSYIYDEYPDKIRIERLTEIMKRRKNSRSDQ